MSAFVSWAPGAGFTADSTPPSTDQESFGKSFVVSPCQPQGVRPSQSSCQPALRSPSVSVFGARPVATGASSLIRADFVAGRRGRHEQLGHPLQTLPPGYSWASSEAVFISIE
jgi:hypothetical protein